MEFGCCTMKPKLLFVLCVILMFSTSCKNSFNAAKWNEGGVDWQMSNTREKMVDDLIESDTLIGLDTNQVLTLLGKPEFTDDSTLSFLVREKYSFDIDPDYVKYLNVSIENGLVTHCSIVRTP